MLDFVVPALKSHLLREMWIEIARQAVKTNLNRSHLLREMWIEINASEKELREMAESSPAGDVD